MPNSVTFSLLLVIFCKNGKKIRQNRYLLKLSVIGIGTRIDLVPTKIGIKSPFINGVRAGDEIDIYIYKTYKYILIIIHN